MGGESVCLQLPMHTQKMQVDLNINVNKILGGDKAARGKSVHSMRKLSGKKIFNDLILGYFHSNLDRES